VPFNLEADSLNCIVLGNDVTPEMPEWDIFIKEIRKEMTSESWPEMHCHPQNFCA